jgi:hypothetical protein
MIIKFVMLKSILPTVPAMVSAKESCDFTLASMER